MKKLFVYLCIILMIGTAQAAAFTVSSPFGWRVSPITHRREFHTGIDIPLKYGQSILAVMRGQVVLAGPYGGYGNTVVIRHTNTTYTLYGHCTKVYVRVGQIVSKGQLIAAAGNTGNSRGVHVHLEYWVNRHYVDPMRIWQH